MVAFVRAAWTSKYKNKSQSKWVATLLTPSKTMNISIALRRRWDDSMSLCAVLNGSSNVYECWYRCCTLWLDHMPSGNVAAQVLNTFQNVSLYFDIYLTQEERKNVNTVNDSTVRQCHMDHRRSWVRRPSWGWRASTRRILNDGWVRTCQIDVNIQHIVLEMCRDLTYTTKTRWVY